MSAVASMPVVSRSSVVRCERCGVSRPAAHAHCYACGRKLGERRRRIPGLGGVARAGEWVRARAASAFRRRPPRAATIGAKGLPAVAPTMALLPLKPMRPASYQARTWVDGMARWYAAVSAVGVAVWMAVGQPVTVTVPAACASEEVRSEACAWLVEQRTQVMGEVGKVADAQRPVVAGRLAELAALVGAGAR